MKRFKVHPLSGSYLVVLWVLFALCAVGYSQPLHPQAVGELCSQDFRQLTAYAARHMWNFPAHTSAEDIVQEAVICTLKAQEKGQEIPDLMGWLQRKIIHVIVEKKRLQATWREVLADSVHSPPLPSAPVEAESVISQINARNVLRILRSHLGEERFGILEAHSSGQSVSQIAIERQLGQHIVQSSLQTARRHAQKFWAALALVGVAIVALVGVATVAEEILEYKADASTLWRSSREERVQSAALVTTSFTRVRSELDRVWKASP